MWFPNPRWGEDDGLVAIGGDLSVERLVLAYSNGFFPWYAFHMEREPHWYCPLDRYVIFPQEIHISHSMRQLLKQQKYEVTLRHAFFGESMFSLVANASKLALIHLARAMVRDGGRFIDCQFETPLFKGMGGRHITYEEYMGLLTR